MNFYPEIYTGVKIGIEEQLKLHAGPLSLSFNHGDLRHVRFDGIEILRRIYVAVRDRNWGTVPAVLLNQKIIQDANSFLITFEVVNQQNEINFSWNGLIRGDAQGTLYFEMKGIALSTFLRNRIGFCVLHPANLAGVQCRVQHVDGTNEEGYFPKWISPDQPVLPFSDMVRLSHLVMPEIWSEVLFSGEVFEMEDQRNWTDASFKTFGTPLRLPFPVEIHQGDRVTQSITLHLFDESKREIHEVSSPISKEAPIELNLDFSDEHYSLPAIGLCSASHSEELSELEIKRLSVLKPHHLRVDINLSDPEYPSRFFRAVRETNSLHSSLDIALHIPTHSEEALTQFAQLLIQARLKINNWLVYPEKEFINGGSPTRESVITAQKFLRNNFPQIPYAAGTNSDFIFLQRSKPPFDLIDKVSLAINPQVHAFDLESMVETLETQRTVIESTRHLCAGLPVIVSPVTLKPRYNPYQTNSEPLLIPDQLPPQVDVRQMSLFGACWTAISLKYLALGGANQVTYYETTGWRGVIETAQGCPLPQVFHSIPGSVYPMYHILADVGEFQGGEVLPVRSTQPWFVDCLAVKIGKKIRMIFVNFKSNLARITIPGIFGRVSVSRMDETNVYDAICSPDEFRSRTPEIVEIAGDHSGFQIPPFGLLRVDLDE